MRRPDALALHPEDRVRSRRFGTGPRRIATGIPDARLDSFATESPARPGGRILGRSLALPALNWVPMQNEPRDPIMPEIKLPFSWGGVSQRLMTARSRAYQSADTPNSLTQVLSRAAAGSEARMPASLREKPAEGRMGGTTGRRPHIDSPGHSTEPQPQPSCRCTRVAPDESAGIHHECTTHRAGPFSGRVCLRRVGRRRISGIKGLLRS
jgi:hypothetical protein